MQQILPTEPSFSHLFSSLLLVILQNHLRPLRCLQDLLAPQILTPSLAHLCTLIAPLLLGWTAVEETHALEELFAWSFLELVFMAGHHLHLIGFLSLFLIFLLLELNSNRLVASHRLVVVFLLLEASPVTSALVLTITLFFVRHASETLLSSPTAWPVGRPSVVVVFAVIEYIGGFGFEAMPIFLCTGGVGMRILKLKAFAERYLFARYLSLIECIIGTGWLVVQVHVDVCFQSVEHGLFVEFVKLPQVEFGLPAVLEIVVDVDFELVVADAEHVVGQQDFYLVVDEFGHHVADFLGQLVEQQFGSHPLDVLAFLAPQFPFDVAAQ